MKWTAISTLKFTSKWSAIHKHLRRWKIFFKTQFKNKIFLKLTININFSKDVNSWVMNQNNNSYQYKNRAKHSIVKCLMTLNLLCIFKNPMIPLIEWLEWIDILWKYEKQIALLNVPEWLVHYWNQSLCPGWRKGPFLDKNVPEYNFHFWRKDGCTIEFATTRIFLKINI